MAAVRSSKLLHKLCCISNVERLCISHLLYTAQAIHTHAGVLSNVWFDHYKISRDCLEHLESIDAMANSLGAVIQVAVRAGVPKHRMIIGGFSMGGAMALHLVYRYHRGVAGFFALSIFLNEDCSISGCGGEGRGGEPPPRAVPGPWDRRRVGVP